MSHNYSRPTPSPTHRRERPSDEVEDQPQPTKRPALPPQPSSRRAGTVVSPTFHIDPERSSSSDNGSLATPFPFYPAPYAQPRDSVTTTHHSSIYPQSTSSYSNTSPPSPASPSEASFPAAPASVAHTDDDGISSSFDPHSGIHHALIDPDDVSYRLRLLVRNNYFLPPAHSKPHPASPPPPLSPSSKSPSAAFRDIFRGLRPAPLNVQASPAPSSKPTIDRRPPPPLRQTRSHGALVRPSHTRNITSASGTGSATTSSTAVPTEPRGRVVVLREVVGNIAVAAKEAEIQMRIHQQNHPREEHSQASEAQDEEGIVDPTDAVDLPSYYFPAQPSGVVGLGLGVDASGLSAAALADALVPPGSPGYGTSREDMLWRRALLHQAVGMSIKSIPSPTATPDVRSAKSSSSNAGGGHSFRGDVSQEGDEVPPVPAVPSNAGSGTTAVHKAALRNAARSHTSPHPNQPILPGLSATVDKVVAQSLARPRTSGSDKAKRVDVEEGHEGGLVKRKRARSVTVPVPVPGVPQRAETPGVPSMPLQPPPRRDVLFPDATIRKTLGTPLLSEAPGYETDGRSSLARSSDYYTPLSPSLVVQSPKGGKKNLKSDMKPSGSVTSGSYYSEDEDDERPSSTFGRESGVQAIMTSNLPTSVKQRKSTPSLTSPGLSRPSHDWGRWPHQGGRESQESSSLAHGHGQPRASTAESHVSNFSTSFGPRGITRSRSPLGREDKRSLGSDEMHMIQPIPKDLFLSSTASEVGLHAFGGVGDFTGPIPRPPRAQTSPTLADRRSKHLRPLDIPAGVFVPQAVRSAPAVERDSFLDMEGEFVGHSSSPEQEIEQGNAHEHRRMRVPSEAPTIVPPPRVFAAPISNTPPPPPPPTPSFFLSTLSSLNKLGRRHRDSRMGDLARYARDPKAKSTPTLSPTKDMTIHPGRRSNASAAAGLARPSEDVVKLDGLVTEHIKAERDFLKRVARGER